MGRAMKNIDKLLAMPFGCGEQNMILFAPNIFILDYLSSTGQLTQEIQDRATRFLKSGESGAVTVGVVETSFWTPLVFSKMTSHSTHPDQQSANTTGV